MAMSQGESWLKIKPRPDIKIIKENRDLFWTTMFEREQIRLRRFRGENPPWTKDKIFRKYKFTNVNRFYDYGTQQLLRFLEEIKSKKKKVWRIVLYRLPNHYAFFDEYGFPSRKRFDPDDFKENLTKFKCSGGRIYTPVHITLQCSFKRSRIDTFADIVNRLSKDFDKFYDGIVNATDMQQAHKHIKSYFGFGDFVSKEVLMDMSYVSVIPKDWPDKFIAAGPGAKEGINIIYPETQITHNYLEKMIKLRDNQEKAFKRLKLNWTSGYIDLHSIQFWCCEFQKYYKYMNGIGRKLRYIHRND